MFISHVVSAVVDLFCSTAWLCLISSHVSYCVCQFGFSFLHTFLATSTSCRSLFLFTVLLYISFHTYLFYTKGFGLLWAK